MTPKETLPAAVPVAPGHPMLWLSHHREDSLHRTYRLGRLSLCARCIGVYPVLVFILVLQARLRAPLAWKGDGFVAVGLLLPATLDWAYGIFRPHAGSNLWRTATGALLGAALGRTLYVHLHLPYPTWLLAQVAVVTAVAAPVIVLRLVRRAG